jgi:two-component system CheB/CheR fusion protein
MKSKTRSPENSSINEGKKVIIAIGSSAGGLDAIKNFLLHFPNQIKNASVIIAAHVAHSPKSMLVTILKKHTKLLVKEAKNGDLIQSGTVYITPADKDILIVKNKIVLKIAQPRPTP